MLKISLSAGHGFNTPGKRTPDGMPEWYFNSVVVKYLMAALAEYENVAVIRLDDPTGVQDIPLDIRSDRSNAWGADIHIDIHANAYGDTWNEANGIETFVNNKNEIESNNLAILVQKNLVESSELKNRGIKESNGSFHMLREIKAKARILVEAGFMTNKKEADLLKSDDYRQLAAKAILDALVVMYSLKKRKEVQSVEKNQVVSPFAKEAHAWVKENGISDGSRPQDPITRQEVWVMLKRMFDKLNQK